jgi:hypothetical protein
MKFSPKVPPSQQHALVNIMELTSILVSIIDHVWSTYSNQGINTIIRNPFTKVLDQGQNCLQKDQSIIY